MTLVTSGVISEPTLQTPLTGAPLAAQTLDLGQGGLDYTSVWKLQRALQSEVISGDRPDTLLLLEHQEVFTAGSRTQPEDRPVVTATARSAASSNVPVVEVDRGGRITWHGPGQLVGYPIVRLPHRLDVVAYVRALEDVLLAVCESFGVLGHRIAGRSGVWVAPTHADKARRTDADAQAAPARKVAAIGVRVSRGVTMHGFALNCDCRLDWSEAIVPCGIADAGVTSLSAETGRQISTQDAAGAVRRALGEPTNLRNPS